ncbi:MAG: riboflavin biosynthesis protein RibF [Bacteroidales bacterium]|jgi:riboflavin kinase/FMN adenylyltransferase|nr:riboflavin biosynthesis protein RibF [Bacteroidales bacterium]
MIIHEGYENLKMISPVVTIGIFDGVHRGHRYLLDTLVSRAKETGTDSAVITFHPHPRLVLEKHTTGLSFLSTMDEKKALLEGAGIDHLIIIEFTSGFSKMKACDFVEEVLLKKIRTRHLVVGHDHHFGYQGRGNFKTINNCALSLGFRVEQVEGLKAEDGPISSSVIRNALLNGKPEYANKLLGYNYSLRGQVVEGKKIGRKIGFPTANIKPGDQYKLIPGDGVYAVEIQVNNSKFKGMLSIGRNPTVNKLKASRSIEVNIFNFEKDIYGKEIEVTFRYRMRDEKKFSNTEELIRQMDIDKAMTTDLLT